MEKDPSIENRFKYQLGKLMNIMLEYYEKNNFTVKLLNGSRKIIKSTQDIVKSIHNSIPGIYYDNLLGQLESCKVDIVIFQMSFGSHLYGEPLIFGNLMEARNVENNYT